MQARNCRERILALKEWRLAQGKTVDQCIELCGDFPSDTTVKRIFAKGSEDKTYRESTIAAIELACLGRVYEPSIKIPVEDVVRAQEDTAKRFADENRLLRYTVERQAHIIKALGRVVLACILFFGAIAFYDLFTKAGGFWNANTYPVWIAKVAFLLCVIGSLAWSTYKIQKLKAQFEAEEAQITEGKL